jgi:hypothetical protein
MSLRDARDGRRRLGIPPVRVPQGLAAAAFAAGLVGFAFSPSAGAQGQDPTTSTTTATNSNTYNLSAQANALDVLVTDPNLPISSLLTIEAGPYGASAALNSLGLSLADAGAPYSPSVSSLPGTIAGLGSGSIPPLPPLPGYVSASFPGTPSRQQTQGGYQISATSSQTDAKGSVAIGVQPAGSNNATMFASAETTANGDGSVSVTATAGLDALSFGQLFDLANVSSSVSLSQQANGKPTIKSQTNLGTITLLGQASGFQGNGLNVLGVNVPIDVNQEVLGTLNSLLAPSGVKLTYLPETVRYTDGTTSTGSSLTSSKTLESIDSGALRITATQNLGAQGTATVAFTVGRGYVSTTDSPGLAPAGGDTGTGVDSGAGSSAPSSSAPLGDTSAGTDLPSVVPGGVGTTPPSSSSSSPAINAKPTYAVEKGPSVESLYLMLILVALAVLLGSQAVRFFSVRLALSSQRSA